MARKKRVCSGAIGARLYPVPISGSGKKPLILISVRSFEKKHAYALDGRCHEGPQQLSAVRTSADRFFLEKNLQKQHKNHVPQSLRKMVVYLRSSARCSTTTHSGSSRTSDRTSAGRSRCSRSSDRAPATVCNAPDLY